ncbi:uncharacterized protein LOC107814015 [Nicotiana tabacum]|uniref:Uncharacterized protein LOC107814015 n=1 Tax=Nicotiana tabacum TaxID=4097 RepID=A0A1S4C1A6_TOBAC|nr:uncharacterized protein LOC104093109 [Nicotiana tomentosiformis]XP_016494824.1 PREDICTED: uncharacterized protein LOC107814015 [Nicotiana tabacum]
MERFLVSQWKFAMKPQIYYHNEDYFVIGFQNLEERNEVLYSRPHTINSRPVIMKAWTPDFNLYEEVLNTIPLWIKLPNLPLNCWTMKSFSKIGSALGNPLYADDCTTSSARISYSRLFVEMDVTRPLPKSVKVQDPNGGAFKQEVAYEWEPAYCVTYLKIGHTYALENNQKPRIHPAGRRNDRPKLAWRNKET